MNINIKKLVQATKKINDKEIQKELDELQKAIDSVKQERLEHVNHIIKKHGLSQVAKTTGVNRGVVTNLISEKNITLDNWDKINAAYPIEMQQNTLGQVPILGNISGENYARPLSTDQKPYFNMPANDIKRFEPCLAFYSKYPDEYESYVYFFSAMNYDPKDFLPKYMINKKIILEVKNCKNCANPTCYVFGHVSAIDDKRITLIDPTNIAQRKVKFSDVYKNKGYKWYLFRFITAPYGVEGLE